MVTLGVERDGEDTVLHFDLVRAPIAHDTEVIILHVKDSFRSNFLNATRFPLPRPPPASPRTHPSPSSSYSELVLLDLLRPQWFILSDDDPPVDSTTGQER